MPSPSRYPRNRKERAALETRQALDDLAQITQINSALQRDEMARTAQDDYLRRQERIEKQQELENTRVLAREAMADQAMNDESAALKFLTTFNSAKPGSEVELSAILAMHPRASTSPAVRDMYGKRMTEVAQNKKFSEIYKTETGGENVPVTEDGAYDMPRANLRASRTRQLGEALSKGLIDKTAFDNWKQTDEYQFANTWTPWIAEKQGAASVLAASRERNAARVGELKDVVGAAKDAMTFAEPSKADALMPDSAGNIQYQKTRAAFAPYVESSTQEIIDRLRSTGPVDPNAPKSAISTLDPANP